MMIISHNSPFSKDKKCFFYRSPKMHSSVFTAGQGLGFPQGGKYKVLVSVDIIPQYIAFAAMGNTEFSPTSTGFSTGKNGGIPSFSSIIFWLTEKCGGKFVTFHRRGPFAFGIAMAAVFGYNSWERKGFKWYRTKEPPSA